MDKKLNQSDQQEVRKLSVESKKTFVKPELIKHGDVKDITGKGFNGSYYN